MLEFSLSSDTWAPAHPAILQALAGANEGFALPYGEDELTEQAEAAVCRLFGRDVKVHFVFNGTGANVAALAAMAKRGGGVLCVDTAHINVHETGAPEKLAGLKLLAVPQQNGKLTPAAVSAIAPQRQNHHFASPDIVSVANVTECGTVYTPEEMGQICATAHQNGMLVHLDGARFANAVAALGCGAAALAAEAGVDVMSFGGTKNGFVFGEAIVFFNLDLAERFFWLHKQFLQLACKNRYIAAQFLAALQNDLWLKNAGAANAAAARLEQALIGYRGMRPAFTRDANMLFLQTEDAALRQKAAAAFGVDDEDGMLRFVASWCVTNAQVDGFVADFKKLAEGW